MTKPIRTVLIAACTLFVAAAAYAEVSVQKTSWQGHDALLVSNGTIEVVLTTGVGPRIIRYAFVGGENVLGESPADAKPTHTALGDWYGYGGHRIWVAPEVMPRTYAPDNDPVKATVQGNTVTLSQPTDAAGYEKVMIVTVAETGTDVKIVHRIVNRGKALVEIAPWALTVMQGGGEVILPSEPYKSHDEELLPTRSMTLWGYTDLSDPRWTWGRRFIRLKVDRARQEPQKIGISNKPGWAAYLRSGLLFVKRYDWIPSSTYPDFGVNTETYTAANFCEVETLGPLRSVGPGQSVTHEERWSLHKGVDAGDTEDSLAAALEPIVRGAALQPR